MSRVLSFFTVLLLASLPNRVFAIELAVTDAYVRTMPPGQALTSAYLSISNHTKQKAVLVGAKSAVAESVEIHQHIHKQGMMGMRQLDSVTIEVGKSINFTPGSYHLMLFKLRQSLAPKQRVTITLCYSDGSEQPVQFIVRRP